jgi:hypothetical protein
MRVVKVMHLGGDLSEEFGLDLSRLRTWAETRNNPGGAGVVVSMEAGALSGALRSVPGSCYLLFDLGESVAAGG